jgi:CheY-like chemotaxis protein
LNVTSIAPTQLLFRADVSRGGRTSAGYTVEVSPTRLLVRAAPVDPPGARVTVRLSSPRLAAALTLHGTVVALHDPQIHQKSAAMSIELQAEPERDRLAQVLGAWRRPLVASDEPASVLVADDNSLIREMFAYGARKFYFRRGRTVRVDTAPAGDVAWALMNEHRYDVLIIDDDLPVLSGGTLVGRIRRDPALAHLPVVLVSQGGPVARLEALDAGADVFLDKPVVLKDLLATLESLTASPETSA